jgi:hypothetical protein
VAAESAEGVKPADGGEAPKKDDKAQAIEKKQPEKK